MIDDLISLKMLLSYDQVFQYGKRTDLKCEAFLEERCGVEAVLVLDFDSLVLSLSCKVPRRVSLAMSIGLVSTDMS